MQMITQGEKSASQCHISVSKSVVADLQYVTCKRLIGCGQDEVPKAESFDHVRKSGVAVALRLLSKIKN
jgi:hypothetical protein